LTGRSSAAAALLLLLPLLLLFASVAGTVGEMQPTDEVEATNAAQMHCDRSLASQLRPR